MKPTNYKLLFAALPALFGAALWPVAARAHDDPPPSSTTNSSDTTVTDATVPGSANIQKWSGRFKGSLLLLDQSTTPDTIAPNSQLSAVPSYQWWISLRPRYYFTPTLSLRARADLTVEWLNAADTTYLHEPQFGDIWLDLAYSGIPKFGGIDTTVAVRLVLPTSKLAQMRTNVLGVSASAGLNRDFKTRIGEFGLSASVIGTYTYSRNSTGQLAGGDTYGCETNEFTAASCDQNAGATNPVFGFTGALSAKYAPISRLSFNVSMILIDQWIAPLQSTETINDAMGGPTTVSTAGSVNLHESTWFLASIDVEAQSWLSLSLGYYTYRPVLDPISAYGDPLFQPGGASRIFFTIGLGLDKLYESIATRAAGHRSSSSSAEAPFIRL